MSQFDLNAQSDALRNLVQSKDVVTLKKIFEELHPADIAEIIEQLFEFEVAEKSFIFSLLDAETASEVIMELEGSDLDDIVANISPTRIKNIVSELESDEAADLVSELDEQVADKVLELVPDDVSSEIKELLTYEEETAGSLMALEIVKVTENQTIGEAIKELRKISKEEDIDDFYNIFVVDEGNKLVGHISLQELVLSKRNTLVNDIMSEPIAWVETSVDQEEVAQIAQKYDLVSIPVVDSQKRLVGRITHDDLADVIAEEAAEDISRLIGSDSEEMYEKSSFATSRLRLPWLLIGLIGEIFSAIVLSRFIGSLEKVVALTFFMPVIMAMAGNCGIQASSVVIRGFATGEYSSSNSKRQFWKEVRVGLINGTICGGIIVGVIWLWFGLNLGIVVGASLTAVMIMASFFGALIPITLRNLNVDPAVATGPFITTSNDVFGLFLYLAFATFFIQTLGIT